jgi:predicted anti-sigma-YlaC factor YlaD
VIAPRCLIIQGNLGRFVDGALDGRRTATVREHLRLCTRCLEAERMARAIPVMLASSLDPPPPPALLPGVLAAFRRRRRREQHATALAVALVLLLAGLALAGPRLLLTPPRPAGAGSRATSAAVVSEDPAASLATGKPASATVAAPSVSSALVPPGQVGQVTVPKLASSACAAPREGPIARAKGPPCQTRPTPKRPNTP